MRTSRPYNPAAQAAKYHRSEQALKASGGKRLAVRLSPASVQALELLMEHHAFASQKEALEWCLAQATGRSPA